MNAWPPNSAYSAAAISRMSASFAMRSRWCALDASHQPEGEYLMKRLYAVTFVIAVSCLSLASAASAEVRPGVQTITEGSGQCTANFVFSDGSNTYLGQSAHCASTGAA